MSEPQLNPFDEPNVQSRVLRLNLRADATERLSPPVAASLPAVQAVDAAYDSQKPSLLQRLMGTAKTKIEASFVSPEGKAAIAELRQKGEQAIVGLRSSHKDETADLQAQIEKLAEQMAAKKAAFAGQVQQSDREVQAAIAKAQADDIARQKAIAEAVQTARKAHDASLVSAIAEKKSEIAELAAARAAEFVSNKPKITTYPGVLSHSGKLLRVLKTAAAQRQDRVAQVNEAMTTNDLTRFPRIKEVWDKEAAEIEKGYQAAIEQNSGGRFARAAVRKQDEYRDEAYKELKAEIDLELRAERAVIKQASFTRAASVITKHATRLVGGSIKNLWSRTAVRTVKNIVHAGANIKDQAEIILAARKDIGAMRTASQAERKNITAASVAPTLNLG